MEHINSILNKIIDNNDKFSNIIILENIKQIWFSKFPKSINQNIKVIRYFNNILYLYTNSVIWKKEILIQKSKIIDIFNTELNSTVIKDIKI